MKNFCARQKWWRSIGGVETGGWPHRTGGRRSNVYEIEAESSLARVKTYARAPIWRGVFCWRHWRAEKISARPRAFLRGSICGQKNFIL